MTSTARTTPVGFLIGLLGSGFSFQKSVAKGIAAHRGDSPAETLQGFRAVEQSRTAPPGPKASWLGETIVHGEDIRRPLGIQHDHPEEAVVELLDFYKGSNTLIGTKSRIAGLRLVATDTDWSYGDGPEVSGPAMSLLLAMTGRPAGLDDLSGDGARQLGQRLTVSA
jgi:uncharacterized protein (TIGR03083 family)